MKNEIAAPIIVKFLKRPKEVKKIYVVEGENKTLKILKPCLSPISLI